MIQRLPQRRELSAKLTEGVISILLAHTEVTVDTFYFASEGGFFAGTVSLASQPVKLAVWFGKLLRRFPGYGILIDTNGRSFWPCVFVNIRRIF